MKLQLLNKSKNGFREVDHEEASLFLGADVDCGGVRRDFYVEYPRGIGVDLGNYNYFFPTKSNSFINKVDRKINITDFWKDVLYNLEFDMNALTVKYQSIDLSKKIT